MAAQTITHFKYFLAILLFLVQVYSCSASPLPSNIARGYVNIQARWLSAGAFAGIIVGTFLALIMIAVLFVKYGPLG